MNDLFQRLKKLGLLPITHEDVPCVSSGIMLLDFILGRGYPLGRIVELFGSEGCGKSYLSLVTISSFQRAGKKAALFDTEHCFDPRWASKVGVDTDDLLVLRPDYGEQVFEGIKLLSEDGCDLIVVDSAAALVPKDELEGSLEDSVVGVQARMISKALRTITSLISRSNTLLIFVNQLREKIAPVSIFGDSSDSPGGRALKFYASIRLRVEKSSLIKDDSKNVLGHYITIKVVKNKVGPPYRFLRLPFYYDRGVDEKQAILEFLLERNIIIQLGRKYRLGERTWPSFDSMYNDVTLDILIPYLNTKPNED